MAEFLSFYNLCPIQDAKEFLGLSKDCDDGNIIATLGKNIIIVITISTQKQIKSWTVLDKLSTKVVYDTKSSKYVAVFGNRNIRCWERDASDINKIKKIKFQRDIADLITHDDLETIVLYCDGSCESLSSAIENRKDEHKSKMAIISPEEHTICHPRICTQSNGRKLLTYFVKNKKANMTELVSFTLYDKNLSPYGKPRRYLLSRSEQGVDLAGYAVFDGEYHSSVLTIWSDSKIFILPLKKETSTEDAPGNFVSMINHLKVNNPLSIIGVSKDCVAIYGANATQEGASLVLYNTQFKVVKAKQFFKIYLKFSKLWVVENCIMLSAGQNLSVVMFRVSRELLSEMLGSQAANNVLNQIGKDFINEEDELEEYFSYRNEVPGTRESKLEEELMLGKDDDIEASRPADGKTIPYQPFDNFEKKLRELCFKNNHVEVMTKANCEDIGVVFSTNSKSTAFSIDETNSLIEHLERNGASEEEITDKIIPLLIEADAVDDIAACFRRYTSISPKSIVDVLCFALSEVKSESITSPISDGEGKNIGENKKCLLNLIVSCAIERDIILPYLRKNVDFQQILFFIEHLFELISDSDREIEQRPETDMFFDADVQILRWFCLALDTHYQEFILIKDVQMLDALVKWKDILLSFTKSSKALNDLAPILRSLVELKKTEEPKLTKWYSIDEVKLY